MKNLLIVVDMQKDFIDGALKNEEAKKAVSEVIKEIRNPKYDEVIFTFDTHQNDYMNTYEGKNLPIPHCIEKTTGWRLNRSIASEIKNLKKVKKIKKPTFGSEKLVFYCKKYADELEEITLVGVCTDICVLSNAILLRAAFKDLPMYIVEKATAATTPEKQDAAIKILESNQIYCRKD